MPSERWEKPARICGWIWPLPAAVDQDQNCISSAPDARTQVSGKIINQWIQMVGCAGRSRPDIFNLYLDLRASELLQMRYIGSAGGADRRTEIRGLVTLIIYHQDGDALQNADLQYLEAERGPATWLLEGKVGGEAESQGRRQGWHERRLSWPDVHHWVILCDGGSLCLTDWDNVLAVAGVGPIHSAPARDSRRHTVTTTDTLLLSYARNILSPVSSPWRPDNSPLPPFSRPPPPPAPPAWPGAEIMCKAGYCSKFDAVSGVWSVDSLLQRATSRW